MSFISSITRLTVDDISKMFGSIAGLDEDLGNVGILLESQHNSEGSVELCCSGDATPVSDSEADLNFDDSLTTIEGDVTEDLDTSSFTSDTFTESGSSVLNKPLYSLSAYSFDNTSLQKPQDANLSLSMNAGMNLYKNVFQLQPLEKLSLKKVEKRPNRIYNTTERKQTEKKNPGMKRNIDRDLPTCTKTLSGLGSDKWCSKKEEFLENKEKSCMVSQSLDKSPCDKNASDVPKFGTVTVKESFIEPPKMNRISRSFHGKSPMNLSYLDITSPRRASEGTHTTTPSFHIMPINSTNKRSDVGTIKLQYSPSNIFFPTDDARRTSTDAIISKSARFTTTIVDESQHAGSILEGNNNTSTGEKKSSQQPLKQSNKECNESKW